MTPITTPSEMAAIDAAASQPVEVLIERAGWAVAVVARRMLGGTYGRRVLVIAGKGNNGADGRVAARLLASAGVRCELVDADEVFAVDSLVGRRHRLDLIIDAGYGTGLRSPITVPDVGQVPVLAVDIPSGIDGLTGEILGGEANGAFTASETVTFAAYKPGLLLGDGATRSGSITVADIGLKIGTEQTSANHVGRNDVIERWPRRSTSAHKWRSPVCVVGGQPDMEGAAGLTASAAFRAGASHVTVGNLSGQPRNPIEAVVVDLSETGPDAWANALRTTLDRGAVLAIGPGTGPDSHQGIRQLVAATAGPLILDAGALAAVANDASREALASRDGPAVLTPHDGEFETLMGYRPGADRLEAARALAAKYQAVALLKGPTTVVADPSGEVLASTAGDQRLATAGSGDVLTGVIAAGLAGGLSPLLAASLSATLVGSAATESHQCGILAGDLPILVGRWMSSRR